MRTANATGEARALLSSAKLVALRKPNGKLRPIAMGDALRKLAMTLVTKFSEKLRFKKLRLLSSPVVARGAQSQVRAGE